MAAKSCTIRCYVLLKVSLCWYRWASNLPVEQDEIGSRIQSNDHSRASCCKDVWLVYVQRRWNDFTVTVLSCWRYRTSSWVNSVNNSIQISQQIFKRALISLLGKDQRETLIFVSLINGKLSQNDLIRASQIGDWVDESCFKALRQYTLYLHTIRSIVELSWTNWVP